MSTMYGAWKCIECGHLAPPSQSEDVPTCGQRDALYCSHCGDMRTLEYTLQLTQVSPKGIPMPKAPGFQATASQQQRLAVETGSSGTAALPVADRASVAPAPSIQCLISFPDVSSLASLTQEQLAKLRDDVGAYLLSIDKEVKDRTLCVICCEKSKDVIFYPCKHKVACTVCAEKLKECPLCRRGIEDKILPFEAN